MSNLDELARNAGVGPDDADLKRLVEVFAHQLRTRGRGHHRALLAAMRKQLDEPATTLEQEVALVLKRRLRLRGPKVADVESVGRALDAREDAS